MAKTASDTTPPESLAGPSTMSILKHAAASATPPVAKSTSTGLPVNKRR